MAEIQRLDGAALMRWGRACLEGLERHRDEINALNVFPVPDGDTGTNLLSTLRTAIENAETSVLTAHRGTVPGAVSSAGSAARAGAASMIPPVAESSTGDASAHLVASAMARGAANGARGNSGIIVSQVLRGIAEAATAGPLTAQTYRIALVRAGELVRGGLSTPVEGTMVTVLDRAACCAGTCPEGSSLADTASAAAEGAAAALEDTPAQLGVLRAAGVVDAGARGLIVLLDAVAEIAGASPPTRPQYLRGTSRVAGDVPSGHLPAVLYEVMYQVGDADEKRIADLRHRLAELGDSVIVVGDGAQTWSAHVHCSDAGAAVEAGMAAGSVSGIRIETLSGSGSVAFAGGPAEYSDGMPCDSGKSGSRASSRAYRREAISAFGHECPQCRRPSASGLGADLGPDGFDTAVSGDQKHPSAHDQRVECVNGEATVAMAAVAQATQGRTSAAQVPADRVVLAVATGAGAATLFETAGAAVLGPDMPLNPAALLTVIWQLPYREVLVLPNGALPAHELVAVGVAARAAHRDVLFLPSSAMVQGLAALAVHDRNRAAVDDAFAMSEAAAGTRWGSLRAGTGRALTMVGTCEAGDGLGLVGQDVVVIDRNVHAAGQTLLDRMLGLGGELVTLLVGAAAPEGLAGGLTAHIDAAFPGVEVTVYTGGQHADLMQIGVE